MSSRNDYESLFLQHGISRNELCMMTDAEFQKTLQYFLDNPNSYQQTTDYSNSGSQYRYISPKLYAQRESRMRRSRREPMIQTQGGWEPAYQPSNSSYQNSYDSYQAPQSSYQSSQDSNTVYPDYSQYQQYDEDAALQAAIQSSLQDHNQYMQNQEQEIPADNYNNEDYNQVYEQYLEMPPEAPREQEAEHDQELEPEPEYPSSSYSHVFKPTKKNERIPQNESQRLLDEQNRDYNRCVEEAFQREMEENLAKHYEENQQQIEREEQEQRLGEVVSKYYSLKPEPATGTTIAVMLNNQRYIRKFDPDSKGEDVYAWVAGQTIDEEDEDERLYFYNFELQAPGIGIISPDETLAEQGVRGRVMMNVVMM